MAGKNKVILKKSNVVNKTPTVSDMDYGEVYVNYASGTGNSFLATKKFDGTVAKFPEDGAVVHIQSAETIYGPKTFMSGITIQTNTSKCYEYYDDDNKCLKFIFE